MPAALSFFEVQRLAAVLMPTSGFFTSATRFMTLGPIAEKPVPLTQAPSPSAAVKASESFVSSFERQVPLTGARWETAFE